MAELRHADPYSSVSAPAGAAAAVRRISWGAIIAGAITALSIMVLLSLLGTAIGSMMVEPAAADPMPSGTAVGIGGAAWSVISLLVAIFAGGWVAGRLAGAPERTDGMIHGWLTWGLCTLLAIFVATSTLSVMLGSVFGALGSITQTAAQGAQGAASSASQMESFDVASLPAPVRSVVERALGEARGAAERAGVRLPQDQAQLTALVQELFTAVMRGDDQAVQRLLTQRTGVTEQEATQTAQRLRTEMQQTRTEVEAAVRSGAQTAADAAALGAFLGFVALALGAAAGILGGMVGTRRHGYY
jgi:hypothetical protein